MDSCLLLSYWYYGLIQRDLKHKKWMTLATIDEGKVAAETSKCTILIKKSKAKAAKAKNENCLISPDRISDASRGKKVKIPSIMTVHVT